jgi:trimethylamine--corrinoid protein Co-methyltransferase
MKIQMQVLSREECERIHESSLDILAKTGMRIETALGRQLLERAGAIVDHGTQIVLFPRNLIEDAIQSAPKEFSLGARRPGWDFFVNQGQSTLNMSGEGTSVIDRKTGTHRPSTNKDWLEVTRLCDAIDEIGIFWRTVTPLDRGDSMADYIDYQMNVFRNFSKHVQDPFMSKDQAPWLLEILKAVFGDKKTIRSTHPFSTLLCPQSPLILTEQYTDAYLALKGWNIPVSIMPMALMGATAPGTMMSTLIQCNCEVLGTLCLVQAAEPGTPIIYSPVATLMDPRSGRYFSGGIENSMMNAAATEMGRFYGFPTTATGLESDNFEPGVQGGYERALNTILPTLARPDILIGPGLLGGDMILSFEQLLIDVEIHRMCSRAGSGIDGGVDKCLSQVIKETGPGGHYIAHPSTLKGLKEGQWYIPKLGVHTSYEQWVESGRKSTIEQAREKVDDLLETHEPLPFDTESQLELENIKTRAKGVRTTYSFS